MFLLLLSEYKIPLLKMTLASNSLAYSQNSCHLTLLNQIMYSLICHSYKINDLKGIITPDCTFQIPFKLVVFGPSSHYLTLLFPWVLAS